MAQFTIVISNLPVTGVCNGVVVEVEDSYYSMFSKSAEEKMSDNDNLKRLYDIGGMHAIAKDLMYNTFMVDLDNLENGAEYHRNAPSKKILSAKVKELNLISVFNDAVQCNSNHMLIDLAIAKKTGDLTDIIVIS